MGQFFNMVRIFLIFIGVCFSSGVFAQKIDPDKLNQQVYELNNDNDFVETIRVLDEIITSSHYTEFDKFHAYLQKSLTYKRLYNYSQAKINLELAHQIGMKSEQKEMVEIRVLVEKIFHAFDFLKFDEVNSLLEKMEGKNLYLLDNQTHAFYISVLGILEKEKGNFQEALRYMDQSISLLRKSNPADLPNIYRKKIEIYTQLKENDLALSAFDSGMLYANKYNIMVYKIGMNESLRDHFRTMENYQRAFFHQQVVDTLKFHYNFTNKSSQIIHFEKELSEKRKNEELESERSLKISLLIISICIGAFALFIYFLFHSNKKKNQKIREENERIRKELDKLVSLSESSKIDYSEYELTPRQIEIIELVRQGKTNKAIGEQLFISENTVKYHLRTIYSILGIENRYDLK